MEPDNDLRDKKNLESDGYPRCQGRFDLYEHRSLPTKSVFSEGSLTNRPLPVQFFWDNNLLKEGFGKVEIWLVRGYNIYEESAGYNRRWKNKFW